MSPALCAMLNGKRLTATDVRPFPSCTIATSSATWCRYRTAQCPQCIASAIRSLAGRCSRGRASTRWHSSWVIVTPTSHGPSTFASSPTLGAGRCGGPARSPNSVTFCAPRTGIRSATRPSPRAGASTLLARPTCVVPASDTRAAFGRRGRLRHPRVARGPLVRRRVIRVKAEGFARVLAVTAATLPTRCAPGSARHRCPALSLRGARLHCEIHRCGGTTRDRARRIANGLTAWPVSAEGSAYTVSRVR